jgi:arylsulfatase A-like enzyme
MDILPTAIEVAGGNIPEGIDGKSLLPIFSDPEGVQLHDHLIWAGSHGFNQGFLVKKTTKTHYTVGRYGTCAWVVIKGDYLLRFQGKLEPGFHLEHWEGRRQMVELYNVIQDPAERNNLAEQYPDMVREMSELFFAKAADFKQPVSWNMEKYQEMMDSKDLFR